jgi:hypothetical protein
MSTAHSPQCLDRLQAASAAFAEWRGSREKRSPIPENLWQAAIALSPFHSICQISKELKLDYAKLKRRIAEATCDDGGSEFIEINAPSLFSAGGCTIQLQSPGGFHMEICADGCQASQCLPLVDLFLAKSR